MNKEIKCIFDNRELNQDGVECGCYYKIEEVNDNKITLSSLGEIIKRTFTKEEITELFV
jgi:hypothetical protein